MAKQKPRCLPGLRFVQGRRLVARRPTVAVPVGHLLYPGRVQIRVHLLLFLLHLVNGRLPVRRQLAPQVNAAERVPAPRPRPLQPPVQAQAIQRLRVELVNLCLFLRRTVRDSGIHSYSGASARPACAAMYGSRRRNTGSTSNRICMAATVSIRVVVSIAPCPVAFMPAGDWLFHRVMGMFSYRSQYLLKVVQQGQGCRRRRRLCVRPRPRRP